MTARGAAWVALAVVLAGSLIVGVTQGRDERTPDERVESIAASIACPTCDGQAVASSDAPSSRNIRNLIEEQVAAGRTDDEVRADVARRFGDDLLLTPGRTGLVGLVWVLPVVALVAAAAGVGCAFLRWRRGAGGGQVSRADRELVARALDDMRSGGGTGGAGGA